MVVVRTYTEIGVESMWRHISVKKCGRKGNMSILYFFKVLMCILCGLMETLNLGIRRGMHRLESLLWTRAILLVATPALLRRRLPWCSCYCPCLAPVSIEGRWVGQAQGMPRPVLIAALAWLQWPQWPAHPRLPGTFPLLAPTAAALLTTWLCGFR